MAKRERSYLPAAGRDWALPLYDPLTRLMGGDAAREALLAQADLSGGRRVLDIGCGTGTLAVRIKRLHPAVEVVGLDPDPKALGRARRKAERAGLSIRFDHGFSDELPYPAASFDRVFSSFMFHHLQPEQREKTLREIARVLAPGGSLHLTDFERPEHKTGGLMGRLHSSEHLQDSVPSRLLTLLRQAGFANPTRVSERTMLFGLLHLGYYRCDAPA